MEPLDTVLAALGGMTLLFPASLLVVFGLAALAGIPLSETRMNQWTFGTTAAGLLASLAILAIMLSVDRQYVPIEFGNWVLIPEEHFHFHLKFVFDRLSVPFVILTFVLCGTIGAFTSRYLHREAGFGRFYICFAVFQAGMVVASLGGSIEVLFFGWEMVGLSSALLVAYFQERPAPAHNGLRVWSVYRIADAAFLVAVIAMHHLTGEGEFTAMMGAGSWPDGAAQVNPNEALFVGLLLLIAVAGKSALIPFSGWLPRAMEGPTPSSAIFYGALSVHLGAYLLLRVSPILDASPWLMAAATVLGLATALYAAIAASVQTDIKSALAFASLIQVGIITAEIGLGFRYVALIHIIGHACLRTLQLLRAPTLIRDYQTIENAIGGRLPDRGSIWSRILPQSIRAWCYRAALERGYLDGMIDAWVIRPFRNTFLWCDAAERKWTDWLSGGRSRESDEVEVHDEVVEELEV